MGVIMFDKDLVIRGGEEIVDDDIAVHGWVEISQGRLVCKNLSCLGLSIDNGGALECEELLANFIEVDNAHNDTSVKATWVRARVVDLVQRAMEEVVNRGDVTADYIQHFGGELNPSWDYVRGKQVVLAKYFESAEDEDAPVLFDVAGIREAIALGRPAFRRKGPLLSLAAPEKTRTQPPPLDESVAELVRWFKEHPGPQRVTLSDLKEWLPRLAALDEEAKVEAAKAIRRAIKSPKLSAERDGLLDEIAPERAPPEPAQKAPAVLRLVRPAKPVDYVRPRPEAWLDEFAHDTDRIEVYGNPEIKELPAGIADFKNLTRLAVRTRLSRIAPELVRCSQLETLDLSSNNLESLPAEIGQLQALQSLNVEWNPLLTRLPDSICTLPKLRQLSVGHTAITDLPADIGNLAELHYLNLHGCNELLELPESFFDLPKLDSLYLHGTRFRVVTLARIRKTFPECHFWNFF